MTTLRGAGVDVDVRRVAQVVIGVSPGGAGVIGVGLFVAGAQKNAQVNSLHQQGVPVEATVSGCIGLMGGSGPIGRLRLPGSFTLGGHHYDEPFRVTFRASRARGSRG